VNWFRKDQEGKFLWPGYGENIRVLKWILERVKGRGKAAETALGFLPTPEAIETDGLSLMHGATKELTSVDKAGWLNGVKEMEKFYSQFGKRMPAEIWDEHRKLSERLEAVSVWKTHTGTSTTTYHDWTTTMRFDRLIQKLLPHDAAFYSFFEESSQNLVNAAELLRQLSRTKTGSDRENLVMQIKELEHHGDNVTHEIFSELNSTFVTPFDREDIHQLASALDDIMDHIDGTALRLSLYKLKKYPDAMLRLVDILQLSITEIHRGVGLLHDLHKTEELQRVFQKVNEYENHADSVFQNAVAALFEEEKNPVQIIKLKEVLVGLETATDKCEDAANVLEGIYIKHA